jgi:hypothetical protein
VQAGDPVLELHYRDAGHLNRALDLVEQACVIEDAPPFPQSLVLETLD